MIREITGKIDRAELRLDIAILKIRLLWNFGVCKKEDITMNQRRFEIRSFIRQAWSFDWVWKSKDLYRQAASKHFGVDL